MVVNKPALLSEMGLFPYQQHQQILDAIHDSNTGGLLVSSISCSSIEASYLVS
jgi:hypothetical protein